MTHHLKHHGYHVNRKRIQRLMRLMGIEAIYPKPKRSTISSEIGFTHTYYGTIR